MKTLRLITFLLSTLLLAIGLLQHPSGVNAQSGGAEMTFEYTDITDVENVPESLAFWNSGFSGSVTLIFDVNGGPVTGEFWGTRGSGTSLMIVYLSFTGEYSGVENGAISGTIEGWRLAKGFYDMFGQLNAALCQAYDCVNQTDWSEYEQFKTPLNGSWNGKITGSEEDGGEFSFTETISAYDIEKSYESTPNTLSGRWTASGAQGMPTPIPVLEELAVPTFIAVAETVGDAGSTTAVEEEFTLFPDAGYPPATSAQSPLIPIGGALLGTALGFWGAGQWGQKPLPVAPGSGLVVSPANGGMVTADEARWQAEKLAEGWVWNETSGGFNATQLQHPSSRDPSILTNLANEAVAKAKNASSPLDDLINNLHQERVESIRGMMDKHQQDYRNHIRDAQFYNTASKVASTVKTAADYSMEALAFATGPVGKGVKTFYDSATATVDVVVTIQDEGWVEGAQKAADSAVDILAGHTGDKGKVIKDIYGEVKDGVQFVSDAQEHGLTTAARNYVDKKVSDQFKEAFLPDADEAGSMAEWVGDKVVSESGEVIIDNGIEQANQLGEDTGRYLFGSDAAGVKL